MLQYTVILYSIQRGYERVDYLGYQLTCIHQAIEHDTDNRVYGDRKIVWHGYAPDMPVRYSAVKVTHTSEVDI